MPTIGSSARITSSAFKTHEELELEAVAVWREARTRAVRRGASLQHHIDVPARPGRLYRGSMSSLIRDVIPRSHLLQGENFENLCKAIRAILRTSGNAICVSGTTKGQPVIWWIADEWVGAVSPHDVDPREKVEARLTPAEAGEDREPQPVIVRSGPSRKEAPVEPTPAATMSREERNQKFYEARDEARAERIAQYDEAVLDALIKAAAPVSVADVMIALNKNFGSAGTIKKRIDGLVEDGLAVLIRPQRGRIPALYASVDAVAVPPVPPLPRPNPTPAPAPKPEPVIARVEPTPEKDRPVPFASHAQTSENAVNIKPDDKFTRRTIMAVYNAAKTLPQPVTAYDVATHAEVSPSTASSVLKHHNELFTRDGTRDRKHTYRTVGATLEAASTPAAPTDYAAPLLARYNEIDNLLKGYDALVQERARLAEALKSLGAL